MARNTSWRRCLNESELTISPGTSIDFSNRRFFLRTQISSIIRRYGEQKSRLESCGVLHPLYLVEGIQRRGHAGAGTWGEGWEEIVSRSQIVTVQTLKTCIMSCCNDGTEISEPQCLTKRH